jgi:DNA (cytosine-5)-methyltransferase 1
VIFSDNSARLTGSMSLVDVSLVHAATVRKGDIHILKELKVVDLFAGCGGMSLGFQGAGFKIAAAYEYWKPAVETYRLNFLDHPVFELDLNDSASIEHVRGFEPDIIIGGPPCQDFSSAGHRDETLGRADLTVKFIELVIGNLPRAFVMENVPRIQKSHLLGVVKEKAINAGYQLEELVIDASFCGVPQARKRYFLIGVLGNRQLSIAENLKDKQATRQMTLRDYFGDDLPFEHYFRVPRTYNRRGVFSVDEPAMTIRGVDRPVPKGYPGHPTDSAPISPEIRTLTVTERAQIQTFPKEFKFFGPKTSVNQMIGNAVPVKLAEFVARELREALEGN